MMNYNENWDINLEKPVDSGDEMWDSIKELHAIKEWFCNSFDNTERTINFVYGEQLLYNEIVVNTGMVGIMINHESIYADMRMRHPLIYSLFDIVEKANEIKARVKMYMDCDTDWVEADIPF